MTWRKWFVRGLVFFFFSASACALVWFQQRTNPAAVREQVLGKFRELFPGASVSVESARLRILGGISVNEVRLTRRDDPDKVELIRIPAAVLYHDKEKMLDGSMSLRKIELEKPRIKLVRHPDGSWNLQGLAAAGKSDQPIPTLVVQQGTISFVDHAEHGTGLALELTDVNLTVINDPIDVLTVDGSAQSTIAGKLQVNGQWNRRGGELTLSLKAQSLPLSTGWSERIVCTAMADKLQGLVLEGKAEVSAELAYRPGHSRALDYDVKLQIRDGKLQHPLLPLAFEQIEALLRLSASEARLEKFQARSGGARVDGRAWALLPCPEQTWEAHLDVKHLRLTDELVARLPQKLRELQSIYHAKGLTSVRLQAAFKDGQVTALESGAPSTVTLLPENLSARYERFQYPVDKINGSVKYEFLSRKTDVDITGSAGDRPVVVKGTWQGTVENAEGRFDIAASDVPIDDQLLAALPAAVEKRVRSFHASGKVDIKAHVSKAASSPKLHTEYHLRVHGAGVCWDDCPYSVEAVGGLIDIYPDHWEFRDFQGTHRNGGRLFLQGKSTLRKDGTMGLVLELSGKQVALDEDLRRALGHVPGMTRAWDTLRPRGRMNFSSVIDRTSPLKEDADITVTVQGLSAVPSFFPYTFDSCAGKVRYHRNRLEFDRLYARRRDAEISVVSGSLVLHPAGGYYADIGDIRFRKLEVDDEFVQALPAGLRSAVQGLDIKGALAGKLKLVVAQANGAGSLPDLFWDGQLWFNDLAFKPGLEVSTASGTLACRGRYDGRQLQGVNGNLMLERATLLKQPLRNVHAGLIVPEDQPDTLVMNLKAPVHGGDITGQVRVEFGSNLRYELNLTASQIDLEQFGRQNLGAKSQIKGLAMARLVLAGQGSDIRSLEGSGTLDVPSGHILNIPLLLDLLKFLGLRWPDRTFFEEVHAAFAVHGPRVRVSRLELLGSAVSLYGKGEFNLDGTDLELDFYPSWARVEQLLPPAVRPVPNAISKNLLTIEMRGKVGSEAGDMQFHKKALPILVDPLLHMRDRINGNPHAGTGPSAPAPATPLVTAPRKNE